MNSFEKRQNAFENKFALDEELKFKATARRNRRLGDWVAALLGLSGDEAVAYAKSVVAADFEEAGDGDVIRKVRADLDAKGKQDVTDEQIVAKLDELMHAAVADVKAGK